MKDEIYIVTASALNVRSEPSTDGDKWELLHKGDRILAADEPSDGWLPIQLDDGDVAYVAEQYVVKEGSEDAPQPEFRRLEPLYSVDDKVDESPIWLQWMISKLGLEEVPGAGNNPEIIEWMKLTTLPRSMWKDSTAWCSVAVNAAFMLNDMEGTRSAAALDWMKWGKKLEEPRLGCVVVFKRYDSNGNLVGGHVAFFLDETDDKVQVIGGNQSNAITKQWYSKKNIVGYRWPDEE